VQAHHIPHVLSKGQNEKQARAHSGFHHWPIEVESPTLGLDL
jgi:hypothetical protein